MYGFNEMVKTVGGQLNKARSDIAFFYTWAGAKAYLDAMSPDVRGNFRIYPSAIFASKEPRSTQPTYEI